MALKIVDAGLKFTKPLIPLDKNKVKFIVLHHPDAKVYSPEQIHKQHIANGWGGAGYNAYIRKDGTIYLLRGDNIGAQAADMNSKSYGVCFEGDFDIENLNDAQFKAGVEFIQYLKRKKYPNVVEVGPHSKYNKTACPGKNFPLTRMLDAIAGIPMEIQDLYSAVECLNHTFPQIMNSPEYWAANAIKGKTIPGELAQALIIKTAKYIRETSK